MRVLLLFVRCFSEMCALFTVEDLHFLEFSFQSVPGWLLKSIPCRAASKVGIFLACKTQLPYTTI